MLLLPALNAMIDITTTRMMAGQFHPPPVIFALLFGLALVSALLVGYGMAGSKARNWLHARPGFGHGGFGLRHSRYRISAFGVYPSRCLDQALLDLRIP